MRWLALVAPLLAACSSHSSGPADLRPREVGPDRTPPERIAVDSRADRSDDRPGDRSRADLPAHDLGSDVGSSFVKNPRSADELAKVCARMMSCLGQSVNECLAEGYSVSGAVTVPACLAKSGGGCAAMMSCNRASMTANPTCTVADTKCVGTVAQTCYPMFTPHLQMQIDCTKFAGTTCSILASSGITLTGCASGGTCSPAGNSCDGTKIVTCFAGKALISLDCSEQDLPCHDGECTGSGEKCQGTLSTCEGSDVIALCLFGYRLRLRCSALGPGFACVPSTKTGARCEQAKLCDPDTSTGTETCSGTKLNLCNGGQPTQVDCAALGFSGCSGGACVP